MGNLLKFLIKTIFKFRYSIHQIGEKRENSLYISNHVSWIDWIILGSLVDGIFIMDRNIYKRFPFFFKLFSVIPISEKDFKSSLRKAGEFLKEGRSVIIFGEGHITYDGQLAKIKKGYLEILKVHEVPIVPIFIEGVWGSIFSRSSKVTKKLNCKTFRRNIYVSFGKPLSGKPTPLEVELAIREASVSAWKEYISQMGTLPNEWIKMAKKRPFQTAIFDANQNNSLSNLKLMTAVFLFEKLIEKRSPEKNIGVLLPSSSASIITNLAILRLQKVPVNLNFTLPEEALLDTIKQSEIETIYTSKKFLEVLESKGVRTEFGKRVLFLEDLKNEIGKVSKILTLLKVLLLPSNFLIRKGDLEDTATIIFSSGSESRPKGIVLSHRNILTNIVQAQHLFNFQKEDKFLSTLPMFHSFGFTITALLPILKSIPLVAFGNPTETSSIERIIKKQNPNIIFGTSTIYRIYTKKISKESFNNFRFIIAGAEKLSKKVRLDFEEKFGQTIFEGYGTTETAPASGVNLPTIFKHGTVGKPLLGTLYRIVNPDTKEYLQNGEDGMITIVGNQIMAGYLNREAPIFEKNGLRHYMTGDKGHLDRDGFLVIVDRYSRFAKVGGEMVSLGLVGDEVSKIVDVEAVAVAIPDEKKGEKIVLLVDREIPDLKQKLLKINPLLIPSQIFVVSEMPTLGSGKIDFSKAKQMAMELCK
jgi:acyl-[acyl-carrier-protein]-phospholipid O-acyltransferase/long-chain-fatty-acid--[acyl-carrier-protein] ligase